MKNLWMVSLGLVAGFTAASCKNGPHHFVQAKIVGLPCAAPGQQLAVPLLIAHTHATGKGLQLYQGGMVRPETISIEKGKKQTFKVRLAECPDGQTKACAERNNWIGGEQTIDIDGTVPDPTVVIAVAGDHPCKVTP
jgi:hypothetical protein